MIKNEKSAKKMAKVLFIIAGIVGAIGIALIAINLVTFMDQVSKSIEGGGGTFAELFKAYFISNVLNYVLNIISVQGSIVALSVIGGIMLLKSNKSDNAEIAESTEKLENVENVENVEDTESIDNSEVIE